MRLQNEMDGRTKKLTIAPSKEEQENMRRFMWTVAVTYPCSYCAEKTVEEMNRNPPNVASRLSLAMWLCSVHNEVNERLGKPIFDCTKVTTKSGGPARSDPL